MKTIMKIIAYLFILLTMAYGQEDPDLGRNMRQLEDQINKIKILAQRYQSEKALALIHRAQVEFALAQNFMNIRRLREARERFMEAKKLADLAARLLLFKPSVNLKSNLDKLMFDAEVALRRSSNEEGRYMLNRARVYQLRGTEAFNSADYMRGQEYFRIAMFYAQKTIEVSGGKGLDINQRVQYQEQLRNVENLLNEVLIHHKVNSELIELIEKAQTLIQKSKDFYNQNQTRQAFSQLQIVERILFRAIDLSQDDKEGDKAQLENNLFSLGQYLSGIELSVQDERNSTARNLVLKANQFYLEARQDFDADKFAAARRKMLLSQRLGMRALRLITPQNEVDDEHILDRINELRNIIQLQEQNTKAQDQSVILLLQKEAENLLGKAEKAYTAGNPSQSFQLIQLALRLINRVEKIMSRENIGEKSFAELKLWSQDLENKLNLLLNNPAANDDIKNRVDLLLDLLNRAKEFLNRNELGVSGEYLDLIQIQLNVLLKSANN